jgi:hypothetical protein
VALVLALAALLALRLAVAFEAGWHHVSRISLACAGRPRGGRAQHFSGVSSRECGRVGVLCGTAPAAVQPRRTLVSADSTRSLMAVHLGLAFARAASDNKSVNTDAQGRPAASPRLSLVAGYVQR